MNQPNTTLFKALDVADEVVIDGYELEDSYQQITPTRRRLDLADDTWITVDDQEICLGEVFDDIVEFTDIDGRKHSAEFRKVRALVMEDLREQEL